MKNFKKMIAISTLTALAATVNIAPTIAAGPGGGAGKVNIQDLSFVLHQGGGGGAGKVNVQDLSFTRHYGGGGGAGKVNVQDLSFIKGSNDFYINTRDANGKVKKIKARLSSSQREKLKSLAPKQKASYMKQIIHQQMAKAGYKPAGLKVDKKMVMKKSVMQPMKKK